VSNSPVTIFISAAPALEVSRQMQQAAKRKVPPVGRAPTPADVCARSRKPAGGHVGRALVSDSPMSTEPPPDQAPDQIVLDFLAGLPATVREPVLFKCCFGVEASGFAELAFDDKLAILEKFLRDPGSSRSYRCAQLIGVIEVILEPGPPATAERPLMERHLAAARESFRQLRQDVLSPGALAAWQDLLSPERPWIEDAE
jgi:hypothetical protein